MQVPNFNYQRWLIISICMLILGVGFGFFAFPKLLTKMIKGQINTAPGSTVRPLYVNTPFFLNFIVHLFNVTNKEEIMEGKNPKLQEIGPYFFEEWKDKFDLVDDEEQDTLTYHYRNKFILRPDISAPLTGEETVVMAHPLIMGLLLATNYDKQPMLPTIENVVKNLFNNPADAFFTGRAMDIMFDGVVVDCTSDDKVTAAVCLQFDDSKSFVKVDDGHKKFSLFGGPPMCRNDGNVCTEQIVSRWKTNVSQKSSQQTKLIEVLKYSMLKYITCY